MAPQLGIVWLCLLHGAASHTVDGVLKTEALEPGLVVPRGGSGQSSVPSVLMSVGRPLWEVQTPFQQKPPIERGEDSSMVAGPKKVRDRIVKEETSFAAVFTVSCVIYGSSGVLWLAYLVTSWAQKLPYCKVVLLSYTWITASVGMQMLNKSLVSTLHTPAVLALVQMVVAVVCMSAMAGRNMCRVACRQLAIWMIVPCFFAGVLLSSFYTYSYISLSLMTVLRNLTPMIVLPLETYLMPEGRRTKISPGVIWSIFAMAFGAALYATSTKWGGISAIGIGFAFFNMAVAALDRLIQRRLLSEECQGLPSSVCTVMNNLFGAIPAVLIAQCSGQLSDVWSGGADSAWLDVRVILLVILSSFVGLAMGYFGLELQRDISATSFMVMQNFSKVGTIVSGIVIFQDLLSSAWGVLGLAMSVAGSFMYGYIQMRDTADQAKKPADAAAPPGDAPKEVAR